MRAVRLMVASGLAALLCLGGLPSRAADPVPAAVTSPALDATAGIVVSGQGRDVTVTIAALGALPSVTIPGETTPGGRERSFAGPLLWTVLAHAGAVDPAQHQADVRGTVQLTGRDGYVAILALGELSPEFAGKQIILALQVNGQTLEPGHLRVVVPGDKRGGRSVRDLARVAVTTLPGKP